jgi:glycosyltransferase involved in cell wall biosynthesis
MTDESPTVTVAVPVLDGGALLGEVLDAVRRQRDVGDVELLVCDSGSTDGSVAVARRHGAEVMQIPAAAFSHGRTRDALMARASGDIVAFLTQDATPAHDRWLAELAGGFALADDVALVHGPYLPRPGARPAVARELAQLFAGFSPDGAPVVDRASADRAWRDVSSRATFFTDANGAVARRAWEDIGFPDVPYAEDRLLALRMLDAGWAKAYIPAAGVLHSHDYRAWDLFRRYFDEFRGLRETFGHVEPANPRRTLGLLRRHVAADRAWCRASGVSAGELDHETLHSALHFAIRAAGSQLGSRADRLPPRVRRACSLERRSTFDPATAAPSRPAPDLAVVTVDPTTPPA